MSVTRLLSGNPLAMLVVLSLSVLVACSGTSEEPPEGSASSSSGLAQRLDTFHRETMVAHDIPGLTVAVVQDGETVYSNAFGVTSVDTQEPLTTGHIFHFASVSKPFVATAIMQLVEEGKLDLDGRVTEYLPYFRLADPSFKQITVRQILTHTSGMPFVESYEWDNPQTGEDEAEIYVRELATRNMASEPGERTRYNNRAFDTLGDLIAKVSGQSFEDYTKSRILDPLGMQESTFFYPETKESLRTVGHLLDARPYVSEHYPYNRRHAPSSTLNSSVDEMTRWLMANLNRGELDGTRIVSRASHEALWSQQRSWGEDGHVGLSWFLRESDGVKTVSHSGGDTGFSSYIEMLPDKNLGYVLACNYSGCPTGELARGIRAILLGKDPEPPLRSIRLDFAPIYYEQGIDAAKEFHRRAEAGEEGEYRFHDLALNGLGYQLMRKGEIDRAIEIFEFNVELYPEVGNCYDSLGEAYLSKGERELAKISYHKALELDPENENAKNVLEELESS